MQNTESNQYVTSARFSDRNSESKPLQQDEAEDQKEGKFVETNSLS